MRHCTPYGCRGLRASSYGDDFALKSSGAREYVEDLRLVDVEINMWRGLVALMASARSMSCLASCTLVGRWSRLLGAAHGSGPGSKFGSPDDWFHCCDVQASPCPSTRHLRMLANESLG